TRRNAALARKAAKKPVVLPPLPPAGRPPAPQPLLIDEPSEEPSGWADELDLAWDESAPEVDVEDELEYEEGVEVEPEAEVELEPEVEVEVETEVEVEVEPAPARPSRRREPLRARPSEPTSPADR